MKKETTTRENKRYKINLTFADGEEKLFHESEIQKLHKTINEVEKRLLRTMLYYYISLTALIFIFTR